MAMPHVKLTPIVNNPIKENHEKTLARFRQYSPKILDGR